MRFHIKCLSPIHYTGMINWFCPLSSGDSERLIVTAWNAVAKKPGAVQAQQEGAARLTGTYGEAGGCATLWPHWRKWCFSFLPNTRIIGDSLKTQITRSGAKPQHLQDRRLGNGIFINCPRWVLWLGKFGKHWDHHSLSHLHFRALWIQFLKFSWLNFIWIDQPFLQPYVLAHMYVHVRVCRCTCMWQGWVFLLFS